MPHDCPWWGGCFIDNPIRRPFHDPEKIVAPYVGPGMTAMDIGPAAPPRSLVQSLNTTGNSTVMWVPLPGLLRMLHLPPSQPRPLPDAFQAKMVFLDRLRIEPDPPIPNLDPNTISSVAGG